jgi:hypothetical protein
MSAKYAQTAPANVLDPSADRVLGSLIWNSYRRELASTKVQATQKSWVISVGSILFDLHGLMHRLMFSRIHPGVYCPKGLARRLGVREEAT